MGTTVSGTSIWSPLPLSLGPFIGGSNFTANLLGEEDTRPECWGRAEAVNWVLSFSPPPNYWVHILRLQGDLVAWPKVLPGEEPVKPGQYAGVLLGFQTTGPEGSTRADWLADNTMLYIQDGIMGEPRRAGFNHEIVGGILMADHKLVIKTASWLNTFEKPIHVEVTFTVTYQFSGLFQPLI